MALFKTALVFAAFACISYVRGNEEAVEDLAPLVASVEERLQNATAHVNHMIGLEPLPNQEKLPSLVKNESEHLAYELKKFAGKLQDAVKDGEHSQDVKDAVSAASTQLTEAATTLEQAGNDLKQDNTHYLTAAEHWLQALKKVQAASPCDKVNPIIKDSLKELGHDVDNYQWALHDLIGTHDGAPSQTGHHEHQGHSHHVHQHHGASSEESSESNSDEHKNHHHHH